SSYNDAIRTYELGQSSYNDAIRTYELGQSRYFDAIRIYELGKTIFFVKICFRKRALSFTSCGKGKMMLCFLSLKSDRRKTN
ncbi:MAG: hypothetical protein WCH34_16740, partial [Bacteroidota bacterium]